MKTLTNQQKWFIGGILLLLMIITRSHFIDHIQDASWAIFFLAGFYLRHYLSFPIFWLATFAIDLIVIDSVGSTHYCFTPAYPFLIPAYASLWFAGHWVAKFYQERPYYLLNIGGSAFLAVISCFLISNIGFYAFSSYFTNMSILEYSESVLKYLPMYLQTTFWYLGITILIHIAFLQINKHKKQIPSV